MKIFLISGSTESGKNEVARLIKEYYIYNYKKCAITGFGKYIKNFVSELTDWDGNMLTAKISDFQMIGKKIREINPDFLIDNMIKDMSVYEGFVDNVIISDVMLPREIDALKNVFDEVYSINVENQFKQSDLTVSELIDLTEIALDNYSDFDYNVVNENLDVLKEKIFKIMEEIK